MKVSAAFLSTMILLPVISAQHSLSGFGEAEGLGDFENLKNNLGRALSKPAGWNCHINGCHGGQVCAGTDTAHACVDPMGEGQNCGQDPYWVCRADLSCNGGICERPPHQNDCSFTGCVSGFVCAGPVGGVQCIRPQFQQFAPDCSATGCQGDQKCAGPAHALECVAPMKEGQKCQVDPYWVCADGLYCEGGVCKSPVVHDCVTTGCAAGQKCAGVPGNFICVTPMKENGNCGQDPYWVCEDGLNCEGGICKSPVVQDCLTTGCAAGQKCAGLPGAYICVAPMKENAPCGQDPYWVCEEGLKCDGGFCKHPTPTVDDCSVSGCQSGKICAGPVGAKQCVTLMREGEQCDIDPYWVCDKSFICEGFICKSRTPNGPISRGGDCTAEGSICEPKLVCAGRKKMKCVRPLTEGRQCGQDPFWVCRDGLTCLNGICRRDGADDGAISRGGRCNFVGAVCEEGTKCVGTEKRKVCRRPKRVGKKCETNPFRFCADGLKCVHNRCQA